MKGNLLRRVALLAAIPFFQTVSALAEDAICWYEPQTATQDEQITIYYDATKGNAGLKDYTGDVYTHCGIINSVSTEWQHDPSKWCDNDSKYLMTRSDDNPNLYTLTMVPSTYFNLNEGEVITKLAFVMRNANGSLVGKTNTGGDIFVDFKNRANPSTDKMLGKLISFDDNGTSVTATCEHGTLTITPYNDYVIKIFPRLTSARGDERKSVSVYATPQCDYTTADTDGTLDIITPGTTVSVNKSDSKVTFRDNNGRTVLAEDPSAEVLNADGSRGFRFLGMNDAAFYGGGYNGRVTNHAGGVINIDNQQNYGWHKNYLSNYANNICIPFVVSTSGYGLLFDDHHRRAKIKPSAHGTEYVTNCPTPIAYYYVGGDGSMASVLENYTYLTGRQELPPYWALGYITSKYGYKSRSEAEGVVSSIKNSGLPLDGIVFDLYWQGYDESGMGNLNWVGDWGNPQDMMAGFKSQGVNTVCITEPFFTSKSANYSVLQSRGYLADDNVSGMEWLKSPQVGLIDATNPDAMDWFWDFYRQRTSEGINGWWLDLGEPERHDDDSHHLTGTPDQVHNEIGILWIERVYRGLKQEFADKRPFLMPRAGAAGMQRYSTFPWTGDISRSWEGLQAQVPALVSASMSGVGYMGSDVGGFVASGTDANLYLRWVQMATLSPMMRTHSTVQPEPTNSCYSSVFESVRDFINMRYSYLPYTYTLAWENATKGTPLARPVNFHSTEASELNDCIDQYLWGRDILVAPVLSYATSRQISFPKGEWVDLNDMKSVYAGGTSVQYSAPLNVLPHFGRKGSFIPRFSQKSFTNTGDIDHSKLTVTYLKNDGETPAESVMFDDDRNSPTSLTDGNYMITTFSGENYGNDHVINVSHQGNGYDGMPQERLYTFIVPGYTNPIDHIEHITELSSRSVNNLPKADTKEQFDNATDQCYFRDLDNTLYMKAPMSSRDNERLYVASTFTSAIDKVEASSLLSLSYDSHARLFSYAIPSGWNDGKISVVSLLGSTVNVIDGLTASGAISQTPLCDVTPGVYVATLSATDSNGDRVSRTVKISVTR